MKPLEIVQISTSSVACSGKEVPLDHPKVYLQINPKYGHIDCPYCGKRFKFLTSKKNSDSE